MLYLPRPRPIEMDEMAYSEEPADDSRLYLPMIRAKFHYGVLRMEQLFDARESEEARRQGALAQLNGYLQNVWRTTLVPLMEGQPIVPVPNEERATNWYTLVVLDKPIHHDNVTRYELLGDSRIHDTPKWAIVVHHIEAESLDHARQLLNERYTYGSRDYHLFAAFLGKHEEIRALQAEVSERPTLTR